LDKSIILENAVADVVGAPSKARCVFGRSDRALEGAPASGDITLTEQQDGWVKAQINSECIRDLIRREQERSAELEAIRSALIEGEASGEPKCFDVAAFKQKMLAHG